jgi:hypothetical protein
MSKKTKIQRKTPEEALAVLDSALAEVHEYMGLEDNWLTIKKELLRYLPPGIRHAFSTRDPITKKQRTNDFERELAKRWSVLTGRAVVFMTDEEKSDAGAPT